MTAKAVNRAPDAEDDGILRIGDTPEEPKYDVLFRLKGKPYEGLVNPDGSVLVRYLDTQRKRGADMALSWLLEKILKPDAYTALMSGGVSRPEFDEVCELVRKITFGRETIPKSPSGQRRTSG